MFGRKKEPVAPPAKRPAGGGGAALMAQMGFGMDMDAMVYGDVENDADLEAELRALQEDDDPGFSKQQRGKASKGNVNAMLNLDRMVADCMRDEPDDDDDISDVDDADLEAELANLGSESDEGDAQPPKKPSVASRTADLHISSGPSTLSTLQDRLSMYQQAYSHAKAASDSSKARRLERGLQTLEGLIKQAKAGKPVAEDDIPPPVAASVTKSPSSSEVLNQPSVPAANRSPVSSPAVTAAATTSGVGPTGLTPVGTVPPGPPPTKPRAVVSPVSTQATGESGGVISVAKAAMNAPAVPLQTGPASASSPSRQDQRQLLSARRDQYKMAAIKAKQAGNTETAVEYMKTYKQFEAAITALDEGQPVDLAKLPSMAPPSEPGSAVHAKPTSQVLPVPRNTNQNVAVEEPLPELTVEDKQKLFKAPETASTVMEALQQRLAKYKEAEEQAKQAGDNSKMKRHGRIVKQYEDAIKLHKAGKPVDYDELPCPPGFPPIPTESAAEGRKPANTPTAGSQTPAGPRQAAPSPATQVPKVAPKPGIQRQASAYSRAEQQTTFLLDRQMQFKQAAMAAKTSGDIELAKKYLRLAKGFDQMIDASRSGLPVDLSQIPAPPGNSDDSGFVLVNAADAAASDEPSGDRQTVYKQLQEELLQQIKTCESNRNHFTKLGDVSSATKFDKLYQGTRKDLDALKNAYEHGDPVPRFHYETRQFSLVQCCTDLGDNDVELTVVRGLNYNLPTGFSATDMNTYVKYEFPFPTETPLTGETSVCKGTNSPEYNQSFKLDVNRTSRAFLRLLKSTKTCKLEVWYKRGFLKGDKLLGTASIKLQPLEDKCVYHDSYDLMEGRKAVGGKLEVKIRVRDPYVNKQVEEVKEKWLIIDEFERRPAPAAAPPVAARASATAAAATSSASGASSLSVLRYERQLLDQQIAKYQSKLKPNELEALQNKGRGIDKQMNDISERLKKGGVPAYKSYVDSIARLQLAYMDEAKALAKQNASQDKIQIVLTKKKLVDKEVESIRQKFPVT